MKQTIVMFTAIGLGSLLAACSSSSTTGTPTPTSAPVSTPTSTPVPTPTPAATPTAAQPPPAVVLSGTWSGSYSGVYSGTLKLTWVQTGSTLNGDIVLSSPNRTFHISGNVAGSAITFGSVGNVSYTGTVSSNSMSGTYTVLGGSSGGSWSASKS